MEIELESVERLRFEDGAPVRAASAVAPWAGGYVVVQDDGTHAAWVTGTSVTAVRLLPAVEGREVFDKASGTKHLKPDLESACEVTVDDQPAVLAMGSGSSGQRMRWSLLRLTDGRPRSVTTDMTPLYAAVANDLSVSPDELNLEGACVIDGTLRWYQRGLPSAGLPSGSVDLGLGAVLAAALGRAEPGAVPVTSARHYDLGELEGVGLAVTDAVVLPGHRVLVSAAAEDSPNPRDDGPVVGSALVRLDGCAVADVTPFPLVEGAVSKVEGLLVLEADAGQARLLAVVDVDDPDTASLALRLRVHPDA
jgi:hypothetical protein